MIIQAPEGLEATYILINDGDISINSSDDGINASKKSSSFTTPTVEINGGSLSITMSGSDVDGIDVNGNIIVSGGTIDIESTDDAVHSEKTVTITGKGDFAGTATVEAK